MEERDLKFSDWPMFDRVMESNPEICRRVLELLLGEPVAAVERIVSERSIAPRAGAHGVRLDVVMRAGGAIYDVEMQSYSRKDLGRRMRYYQAAMDTAALRPGMDYDSLPQGYVVFLCSYDHFGDNLPVYTFSMVCAESADAHLDHGFTWVIANASAWRKLPEGGLRNLLQYVAGKGGVDDPLVNEIAAAVEKANSDERWRRENFVMLTLEEDMRAQARIMHREGREEGLKEGLKEGEDRMAALIARLMESDRTDDAFAAVTDQARRVELFEELGV